MLDHNIKLLILDVDGVLTDGGMYYTESGDEFKVFNAKDGLAIQRLSTEFRLDVGIISSGHNINLIQRRASLLKIKHVYVGKDDKMAVLKEWCEQLNITLNEVAYIGDDLNDMECMQQVGIAACPSDAVEKIRNISKNVLKRKGGDACVREFIEMYWNI